jgi:hypothetical protein
LGLDRCGLQCGAHSSSDLSLVSPATSAGGTPRINPRRLSLAANPVSHLYAHARLEPWRDETSAAQALEVMHK